MTIHFSNPGETDPRLLTTLGINVKNTSQPIGMFGTGFKYALATCLRLGQTVQVYSGEDVFNFFYKSDVVRGKEFNFVFMQKNGTASQALGFTTALGLNWKLEHAYREFFSNMKDEGGDYGPHPGAGHTTVAVSGKEFEAVHASRDTFILDPKERVLIEKNDEVEIYAGKSEQVFFRGIAAYPLRKPSIYTYNILSAMELTEDRTISSTWNMFYSLMRKVSTSQNRIIVADCLTASEETFERQFDYDWSNNRPGETFQTVLREKMKTDILRVVPTAQAVFMKGHAIKDIEFDVKELSEQEEEYLLQQISFCKELGFPIRRESVSIVESLGKDVMGMARDKEILLSYQTFKSYLVRETLLEEFVHIHHGCQDGTREMQNILFAHICRLGEALIAANSTAKVQIKMIEVQPGIPAGKKLLEDEVPF